MIIGVCGGTGSGKSTMVDSISKKLNTNVLLTISQDSYYKHHPELSFDERCQLNFDHPDAIAFRLLAQHLKQLSNHLTVQQPLYCFEQHLRLKKTLTLKPKPLIILEGILLFAAPELGTLLDYKIFIDAPEKVRLKRRLARDLKERGRTKQEVLNRFKNTLKPMHDTFIEPHKVGSDYIISNPNDDPKAIDQFNELIRKLIS